MKVEIAIGYALWFCVLAFFITLFSSCLIDCKKENVVGTKTTAKFWTPSNFVVLETSEEFDRYMEGKKIFYPSISFEEFKENIGDERVIIYLSDQRARYVVANGSLVFAVFGSYEGDLPLFNYNNNPKYLGDGNVEWTAGDTKWSNIIFLSGFVSVVITFAGAVILFGVAIFIRWIACQIWGYEAVDSLFNRRLWNFSK